MKWTAIAAVSALALAGCVAQDAETFEAPTTVETPGAAARGEASPDAVPVARIGGCIVYRITDGPNTIYATTPSGNHSGCSLASAPNKDS